MAVLVPLASLLVQETKSAILTTLLGVAKSIGLPVDSWQAGDPTRTLFSAEAEALSTLEGVVVGFIASGFLDYATGIWLKILAQQVYGVTVPEASYATTTVRLTNTGGGYYPEIDPNDLSFKNLVSGKTYHNTTGGTLASGPGTYLDLVVEADDAGSAGSAAAGEIGTLVTTLLGVTCSNALPAVGTDEQSEDTTRQQCRDKLGSFSPNGPKEAYSYVSRNTALTGTSAISRVRVFSASDTGDVTVYLASASGGALEVDRALVEAAVLKWATPLCITPTVLAAVNVVVPISYELWVYKSVNLTADQVAVAVNAALQQLFATRPIGGDIIPPASGSMYRSLILSTIRGVFPQAFRALVSTPAADVVLANNQVATLGIVTPLVHLVTDP